MADFFGIRNENEFYFAHYLSSLMDDELKDICSSEALKITQEHLKRLVQPYQQLKAKRERLSSRRGTFKDDVATYLEARRGFVEGLADALGFTSYFNRSSVFAGKEITIPVSGMVKNPNGEVAVLLIESYRDFNGIGAIPDPTVLGNYLERSQLAEKDIPEASSRYLENRMLTGSKNQYPIWENLLGNEIFNAPSAPRFVVVFGENAILLADRTKWAERRSMIFDLDEICERQEAATFRAMAALLAKESLAPDGAVSLPDRLNENSHRNAFGVSKSLRFAMREAIELLGNAILENNPSARTVTAEGTTNAFAAEKLSKECIIVMYRFLFVLFLESRKDLGYFERAEGTDDVFWSAYGLDHLRDLETVPLLTEADRNGHYFDESIKQLFSKIWFGVGYNGNDKKESGCKETFRIKPLKAHLFDPKRTELFNRAKIPNAVWQKIIYSLSIGESGSGKRKRKGRISYAQLGIQQLGSVYEALLSYTGFYAKEDLYEVCSAGVKSGAAVGDGEQDSDDANESEEAGAKADVFETGYFVTAKDLESYKPAERVTDPENPGKLLCHKKGTFIYRMAGRDRERSASYYTPTELTRCLVKQAIAERVTPEMSSKEIMQLSVCEPAMGSAAFLNEMVDQLADIYLKRAQAEKGTIIPIEQYAAEKARVKMVIADRNVYGVDLNPMAADLAEVSLWLGTIGGEKLPTGQENDEPYIPWFGTQLKCGNSIIGARREVVFRNGKHQKVGFNEPVPPGGVWHFLLPNDDMAPNLDKVVKEIVGKPVVDAFRKWAREFQLPDKEKAKEAVKFDNLWRRLDRLTDAIDKLWHEAADDLRELDENTLDDVAYFGYKPKKKGGGGIEFKDQQLSLAQSQNAKTLESTSAYFRLKSIMDINCAMWFWPLDESEKLPSYEDFLLVAQLLAKKDISGTTQQLTLDLGDEMTIEEKDARIAAFRKSPTLDKLYEAFPFTKVAQTVASRQRFLHWELEFAPIFKSRGGFDLVIGNPPWVKLQWEEAGILSEYDPHIAVRKISASDTMALRKGVFENYRGSTFAYLSEYVDTVGTKSFLGAGDNYPSLVGVQTNLFKFFLPLSFRVCGHNGVSGFIHPEGVYDDPSGGKLRSDIYSRLRLHAQFVNELKLFDIDHHVTYSLNVYGPQKANIRFKTIAKLYHPSTLEESLSRTDASLELPLERNAQGTWNTLGHPDRVIEVTEATLELFSRLYDAAGTASREARLPALYTRRFLSPILESIAKSPKKLFQMEYGVAECWHETMSQKDGSIQRHTSFPKTSEDVIYTGPLFYVATPINKTARKVSRINSDFDNVDLTVTPSQYRPRTNYSSAVTIEEYRNRIGTYEGKRITEYYRAICRNFITNSMERTLIPILAPKGWAHVHSVIEYIFNDRVDMSELTSTFGSWSALPYDWFVRSTGKSNFANSTARLLPVIPTNAFVSSRALLLNCIVSDYIDLWRDAWDDAYRSDNWLSVDPHLTKWAEHVAAGSEWKWETPLRTQLDRRQALVELDVIVTKALGLSLDDLLLMYRVSFPTMRKYDADTYYDQNGRCVFSAKSGESYLSRKEWDEIRDMKTGEFHKTITETVFSDEPTERTIVYKAPFFKKCREDDYREAWEMLEKREVR